MVTLFPALLALLDEAGGPGRAGRRRRAVARAMWLERIIRVSQDDPGGDRGPDRVRRLERRPRRLRLQHAQASGQGRGVRGVGGADPRQGGALGLRRARHRLEPRRAPAESRRPSPPCRRSSKVESVLMLVPDRQPEKVKLDPAIRPAGGARARGDGDRARARRAARAARDAAAAPAAGHRGGERQGPQRGAARPGQARARSSTSSAGADPRQAGPALEQLQEQIARDFADKLTSFQKSLTPRPVEPGDAPPELRHRYVGASGRYLLRIHPAVDIWQQAGAERFVTDLRRVDPDVTGPPITSYEAIRFIRHGYFQGTLYALAARGRRHRGHPSQRARHRARAGPARPGRPVDARLHARLRPGVQSRQRVGAAADHRHGGRVRAQHLRAVPGGPRHGRRPRWRRAP